MLLWVLGALIIMAGVVLAGSERMRGTSRGVATRFASEGQARQVAESGLLDALVWLRRQATQPVTDFTPRRDLEADPPVDETDDPAIGLVRSFQISPGVWGRYVVRRGQNAEDFDDENGNGIYDVGENVYDTDGNGRRTLGYGARDITAYRDPTGGTSVWYLECEGSVYARPRADLPLGEGPNQRIGFARLATEVRRTVVVIPSLAALVAGIGDRVKIKDRTRIISPDVGVSYAEGTGRPKIGDDVVMEANTPHAPVPPLGGVRDSHKDPVDRDAVAQEIFGVDFDTLVAMADVGIGWNADEIEGLWQKPWKKDRLPFTIPEDALVVINARKSKTNPLKKVKFDEKYPLRGSGIVVIDGNVEFKKGSNSQFDGILIVLGDLKIQGPATFNGTVIAMGKVDVKGKRGDVEIAHDAATIARVMDVVGQYRRSKAPFEPVPHFLDERPNESGLGRRRFGGLEAERVEALPTDQLIR